MSYEVRNHYMRRQGLTRKAVGIRAGVGLLAMSLAACATISSQPTATTKDPRILFHYAVAQTYFVVQVTAASAGSGTAAAGADTSAATSSTTVTVATGQKKATAGALPLTVEVASGQGKSASGGNSPAPADTTVCGNLQAEYATDQALVAKQVTAYVSLLTSLTAMAAGTDSGETPAQLAKRIEDYHQAINQPAYRQAFDNASLSLGQINTHCPTTVTLSVTPVTAPDPDLSFAFIPRHNEFYNDGGAFALDANGFITSGAPTSVPQAPAILTSLASAAGGVVGAAVAAKVPAALGQRTPAQLVTDLRNAPTNAAAVEIAAKLMHLFETQDSIYFPGSLAALPATLLPLTIYLPLSNLEGHDYLGDANLRKGNWQLEHQAAPLLTALTQSFGINLVLSCEGGVGEPAVNFYSGGPRASALSDGLVVSASRPCQLLASQNRVFAQPIPPGGGTQAAADATLEVPLAMSRLWVQDSRYLHILPAQRGFLATRSVVYGFANGQMTGVTYVRNSETAAILTLPATIVGAFVSGIVSGTSARSAIASAQTSSITTQTGLLTAQTAYLNAQTALATAQAAAKAAAKSGN